MFRINDDGQSNKTTIFVLEEREYQSIKEKNIVIYQNIKKDQEVRKEKKLSMRSRNFTEKVSKRTQEGYTPRLTVKNYSPSRYSRQ